MATDLSEVKACIVAAEDNRSPLGKHHIGLEDTMFGQYRTILLGGAASVIILAVLLALQQSGSSFLSLESRWLLLAGVPILVALIVGGYVYKFKGFGIELETRLRNPLGTSTLQAIDALEPAPGAEKESLSILDNTPTDELARIKRLTMVLGRGGYYDPNAVKEYINRLVSLQFIEIRNPKGAFRCLIPISVIRRDHGLYLEGAIERLVNSVGKSTVLSEFATEAVTDHVNVTDRLIAVLPKVRESKYGWLPVLTAHRVLAGIITRSSVESRIADEVIAAKQYR